MTAEVYEFAWKCLNCSEEGRVCADTKIFKFCPYCGETVKIRMEGTKTWHSWIIGRKTTTTQEVLEAIR